MKRVSFSILFLALLLLLSVASAHNTVEKQNKNEAGGEVDQCNIYCYGIYCCSPRTYCCRVGVCCFSEDHAPLAKFLNHHTP